MLLLLQTPCSYCHELMRKYMLQLSCHKLQIVLSVQVQSKASYCWSMIVLFELGSEHTSSEHSFNTALSLIGFRSGSTNQTNNGTDYYSKLEAILASFPGLPCFLLCFFLLYNNKQKWKSSEKQGSPGNTYHVNDIRWTWGVGVGQSPTPSMYLRASFLLVKQSTSDLV